MKRTQGFALGVGTTLGAIALLNARVIAFAARYHKLPAELRDGSAAAASVQFCLDEHVREMGL